MERVLMQPLTVVRVNKHCRVCGENWKGNFFKEWLRSANFHEFEGKKYVISECDSCIDKWEKDHRRKQLFLVYDKITGDLKRDPTKKVRFRLMRQQVKMLEQIRDTYDAGTAKWNEHDSTINDIETLIAALNAMDKKKKGGKE